jgi:hypothetical protein
MPPLRAPLRASVLPLRAPLRASVLPGFESEAAGVPVPLRVSLIERRASHVAR